MLCRVRIESNCVIADDFERGSRKLAIPYQLILPSQGIITNDGRQALCISKLVRLEPIEHYSSIYEGEFVIKNLSQSTTT